VQNVSAEDCAYLLRFFKCFERLLCWLEFVRVCYGVVGSYCEVEVLRDEFSPSLRLEGGRYSVEGSVYFDEIVGS
jgi:hypothetical protein